MRERERFLCFYFKEKILFTSPIFLSMNFKKIVLFSPKLLKIYVALSILPSASIKFYPLCPNQIYVTIFVGLILLNCMIDSHPSSYFSFSAHGLIVR